jgi:Rieske 2Fe-2S family protein
MEQARSAPAPLPRGTAGAGLLAGLADTARPLDHARTLPREVYTSPAILALEERELFRRMWLCVAREEDFPDPGSFLTCTIAGERILLMRAEDGRIGAYYNVCRHRGSHLVEERCGRLRGALTCPYHAWTYGYDGRLLRTPRPDAGFRKEDYPLEPVQTGSYGGFVFVNLDPHAVPLAEHLATMPDLRHYRLEDLRRAHRIEYEIDANWKVVAENYSECYHCPLVHPQLHRISDVTTGSFYSSACFNGGPMELREGFSTMSMTGLSATGPIEGLPPEEHHQVHYYVVYPNLMLGLDPDYVLVHTAWPLAPGRTRIVCDWLYPATVVARPGFSAADAVEFWDTTNRQDWGLCERVQRGATSQGYSPGPYHSSERCVHAFDQWYAQRLTALLTAEQVL